MELVGDGIRKREGHYLDPIQGIVLSGILMELTEEYNPKVKIQQVT
jgi:hypothetical protein